jgi:hypothetical protein
MVNGKTFELRPIKELLAIVKHDFRKFDDEGLIDEGSLIKTILYCNDRLGIPIREIKQICIPVVEYKAKLPLNFEKLYYTCALSVTNTMVNNLRNPFDNKVDSDVIYNARIDTSCQGCDTKCSIIVDRKTTQTVYNNQTWTPLSVQDAGAGFVHMDSPNKRYAGKYIVEIIDNEIVTPFRSGEIYVMYLATMEDEEGNMLFPFHPMITPYYEWMLKEKVIMDSIFNSDGGNIDMLKLAQSERGKAWLDAYDMTTSKGYGEYVNNQRKKELGWYNQYFKFFQ